MSAVVPPPPPATASTAFGGQGPATREPQGGAHGSRGDADGLWRVSTNTDVHPLAGALSGELRSGHRIHLRAIGAGAVNQAVKAVAIAAGYLLLERLAVACVPVFVTVDVSGTERTAVDLAVFATTVPVTDPSPAGVVAAGAR